MKNKTNKYAINDSTLLQLVDGEWQWINDETGSDTSDSISPSDLTEESFIFFEDSFNAFSLVGKEDVGSCYSLREFVESSCWDYCYDRNGICVF